MLYAKVIYTGVADHKNASARQTVICADRFDFEVVTLEAERQQPIMTIHRGSVREVLHLQGDVWIMNESGKTVSQYAVPTSTLRQSE